MKTPDQKIEELEKRVKEIESNNEKIYQLFEKVSNHIKVQLEINDKTAKAIKLIASI